MRPSGGDIGALRARPALRVLKAPRWSRAGGSGGVRRELQAQRDRRAHRARKVRPVPKDLKGQGVALRSWTATGPSSGLSYSAPLAVPTGPILRINGTLLQVPLEPYLNSLVFEQTPVGFAQWYYVSSDCSGQPLMQSQGTAIVSPVHMTAD